MLVVSIVSLDSRESSSEFKRVDRLVAVELSTGGFPALGGRRRRQKKGRTKRGKKTLALGGGREEEEIRDPPSEGGIATRDFLFSPINGSSRVGNENHRAAPRDASSLPRRRLADVTCPSRAS